jgi:Zn-dependent metalloprotease
MSVSRSVIAFALVSTVFGSAAAAELRSGRAVAAWSAQEASAWASEIDARAARGELTVARVQHDGEFPGRRHVRYDQRVGGVRVFGAQVVRQIDELGATLTVFGRLIEGLTLDTRPVLTADQAVRAAESAAGGGRRGVGEAELVVLALDERPALTYMLWLRDEYRLERVFVDGSDGALVFRYDDLHTAAAAGLGRGVWGDQKKISTDGAEGAFLADDKLRPPALTTYDLRFDLFAAQLFSITGFISPSFVARDDDNTWTDGGVVDAHVYAGWTYDYYFKRLGRRGIDNADLPVRSLVHFAPPNPVRGIVNAFWDSFTSAMYYGDGDGIVYDVFSAGLDVVAHELTHGVTDYTWNGIYRNESGALNEAFSDVMGTAVEFFFEAPGSGRQRADYFLGEDVSKVFNPARFAFRSLENPSQFCSGAIGCDPDHYSRRYLGPLDNGGVHVNSGIANQAFYLLIEGGVNRTSGIRVQGLGASNRDRAERIFYRGFTAFLTPSATFADARAATIQAARELFGAGSNEAGQTATAWTAVGVN